jgi:hypothetical protein
VSKPASGFQHDQRHMPLPSRATAKASPEGRKLDTDADCHAARFVHDPPLRMRARSAHAIVRALGLSDASRAVLARELKGPEGDQADLRPNLAGIAHFFQPSSAVRRPRLESEQRKGVAISLSQRLTNEEIAAGPRKPTAGVRLDVGR